MSTFSMAETVQKEAVNIIEDLDIRNTLDVLMIELIESATRESCWSSEVI